MFAYVPNFCSFFLELNDHWLHLSDQDGVCGSLQSGVIEVLDWFSRPEVQMRPRAAASVNAGLVRVECLRWRSSRS